MKFLRHGSPAFEVGGLPGETLIASFRPPFSGFRQERLNHAPQETGILKNDPNTNQDIGELRKSGSHW